MTCNPRRYDKLSIPPDLHQRIKLLAVQRRLTMIKLIDKAILAFEVVENTLEDAARRTSSSNDGTEDSPNTVVRFSPKSPAA